MRAGGTIRARIAQATPGLCLALILAVACTVYWPLRTYGLVGYDDPLYVSDNPLILQGFSAAGLRAAFSSFHAGYWIPLTWTTFMLDMLVWRGDIGGFHLTNLLLHLANVLLLYLFLRKASGRQWPSLLAAGLLALHPLHVQSVAWVTERKDVLSTFFWLASLLAYLAFQRRRSAGRLLLLAILMALGLMAKPMIITLPIVLLLLDYWPLGRFRPLLDGSGAAFPRMGGLLLEKMPLLALAAASGAVTFIAQRGVGAVVPLNELPFPTRALIAMIGAAGYLEKALLPQGLNVLYVYHPGEWGLLRIAGSALLLVAVSFFAVRWRKSNPYLLAGWLWYLTTLFPVSGLFQSGVQVMADRFIYVPFQGIYLGLAFALAGGARRGRAAGPLIGATAAAALLALAYSSRFEVRFWRDSETLFRRAVALDPRNWVARLNLGIALLDRGEMVGAKAEFAQARDLAPNILAPYVNLSIALIREENYADAERVLTRALSIAPGYPKTLAYLGVALAGQKRWDEALEAHNQAIAANPREPLFRFLRGLTHRDRGAVLEARRDFEEALRLRPWDSEVQANLGALLTAQGNAAEAVQHLEAALAFRSGDATLHNQLGIALSALGRRAEALEHFQTALRLNPQLENAQYNLALSLIEQHRFSEARPYLEDLLRRRPADSAVHYQLGVALRALGDDAASRWHFAEVERLGRRADRASGSGAPSP